MGMGVGIFLMAVGAILAFAVDVPTEGIDLNVVGVILMIFGLVGILASMLFWEDWPPRRRTEYVDDPDVVVRRRRAGYYDYDGPVERRNRDVVHEDRR